MEAGALEDWLLGARPASNCPAGPEENGYQSSNNPDETGYQSSNNLEDWLVARQEGQVRETRV